MIAVIFEVWPHPETRQTYLDIAAALRPRLDEIAGFISIERFQSLSEPDKLLSLSFWRDEEAVAQWRRRGPSPRPSRGTRRRVPGLPATDRGGGARLRFE